MAYCGVDPLDSMDEAYEGTLRMDIEWMRSRLEQYIGLVEEYNAASRAAGYDFTEHVRTLDRQATRAEPTVVQILKQLDSALSVDFVGAGYDLSNGVERCTKALGILDDREEWAVRFTPDSPSLQADQMHPLMWQAASPIWGTGEFKMAVQQAAVALSARIKSKSHSHLTERELAQQVFSPEPAKVGQSRLHFAGDPRDKTWQSRQQGLHLMAQGAFAGIRNVAVHDEAQWSEHEALEHLAVLSVLARWIDETGRTAT